MNFGFGKQLGFPRTRCHETLNHFDLASFVQNGFKRTPASDSDRKLLWCFGQVGPDPSLQRCRLMIVPVDPSDHMYNQAKYGPIDVITGDYLAGQSGLTEKCANGCLTLFSH
jgi:hypothetical protein